MKMRGRLCRPKNHWQYEHNLLMLGSSRNLFLGVRFTTGVNILLLHGASQHVSTNWVVMTPGSSPSIAAIMQRNLLLR